MTKKLSLKKETLVELTADQLSVVAGAGDSDDCSCFAASCITNDLAKILHFEN